MRKASFRAYSSLWSFPQTTMSHVYTKSTSTRAAGRERQPLFSSLLKNPTTKKISLTGMRFEIRRFTGSG